MILLCMRRLKSLFSLGIYAAPRTQLALADLAPAGNFSSSQLILLRCLQLAALINCVMLSPFFTSQSAWYYEHKTTGLAALTSAGYGMYEGHFQFRPLAVPIRRLTWLRDIFMHQNELFWDDEYQVQLPLSSKQFIKTISFCMKQLLCFPCWPLRLGIWEMGTFTFSLS
jgi:hypothetical protein